MKSILIHDWLLSPIGGGENVLKEIHRLFPSLIYTLLSNPKSLDGSYFQGIELHNSFLQNIPFAMKNYRNLFPLFPRAIEGFDLREFDLILSSSHCVAKGVKKTPNQLHICYCHTPIRYAWDLMENYLESVSWFKKLVATPLLKNLRSWDKNCTGRVDHFIANSHFVSKRIKLFYGRDSTVIYPPVDTGFFELNEKKEDYYITTSRLVQNKRVDLLVDAFSKSPKRKLLVIGEGPEKKSLEKLAAKNIEFLGNQSGEALKKLLGKAKGFVFAAIEDFGIAPVEAMATGTPVIALGLGGALETVTKKTGVFFNEQTVSSLMKAINKFESLDFDPNEVRKQAMQFSLETFQKQFQKFVFDKYIEFNLSL